jgi:hypothetical protein
MVSAAARSITTVNLAPTLVKSQTARMMSKMYVAKTDKWRIIFIVLSLFSL